MAPRRSLGPSVVLLGAAFQITVALFRHFLGIVLCAAVTVRGPCGHHHRSVGGGGGVGGGWAVVLVLVIFTLHIATPAAASATAPGDHRWQHGGFADRSHAFALEVAEEGFPLFRVHFVEDLTALGS